MAQCDKILSSYRQQDVVYALMTHLKEREGELKRITEQRNLTLKQKLASDTANQQLQGALAIQRNLLDAKEKTIKSLEYRLEKEGEYSRSSSSASGDKVKQLTDEILSLNQDAVATKEAYTKVITDKDETISKLQSMVEELNAKITKADKKKGSRFYKKLEEEVETLETKLESKLEDLEKQVKRKDWMIGSLKEENESQRHREDNLRVHIRGLQQTIDTYETRFMGKGIDVPMVLAKLEDSEARSKELAEAMCQMEIQMSVLRVEFRKHGLDLEKTEMEFPVKNIPVSDLEAMMASVHSHGSIVSRSDTDITDDEKRTPPSFHDPTMSGDDDDGYTSTFNSVLEPHDPFGKVDRDDLSLLIQDVKDGIVDIQNGGLCRIGACRGHEIRDGPEDVISIDAVVFTETSDD
jgi:DNA repair exonuclease SbcCD ATPase subunit